MVRKNSEVIQYDKEVGQAIYNFRISKGLSRQQLCKQLDVTHQQLQKYEKGLNRISAGRLRFLCKQNNMSVDELLDLYTGEITSKERYLLECMRVMRTMEKGSIQLLMKFLAKIAGKL